MSRWVLLSCFVFATAATFANEGDPRRPAAITTTGVPLVPADLLARLAQYQNVREAAFQGWLSDGSGMLIRTRFGNAPQLHRVTEPGGRREQVTFFDEPVSGRPIPAGKGQLLATLSRGGNENFQIYHLGLEAFRTTLLTDGKSRNELGPVTDDGKRMIVSSNRRTPSDMDLYAVNPHKPGEWELLIKASERWIPHDWSPDGQRFLVDRHVSINESYAFVFDTQTKSLNALPVPAGTEGTSAIGKMVFAADGRTYYLTTDAGSEFRRLARASIDKPAHYEYLTDDLKWDVDDLEVDTKSDRLAFTINEDGASRLFLLKDGKRREIPLSLGVASNLEFSPDGKQLGFSLARPNGPAEAYSVPVAGGEPVRWTYSEVGGLNPASFVVPERIKFASFDGRQIPAWIYRPKKNGTGSEHDRQELEQNDGASVPVSIFRDAEGRDRKTPVLIQIHGGPESQYRPSFSPTTQFYASEGIAVIHPNVRGSAGYGKTYLRLDNAELREDSVKDIEALLEWIARQPDLDASRVAVAGGSYGGYMVLASLVHFGDRLKAGVDYVGIANFITFLERTSPYRQDLRRAEYGDERDPKMRAVFERINPTANAGKIVSALMVAHGRNDPRVPFSEAEQIVEIVRGSSAEGGEDSGSGREVWTVYADNEGHGFNKKDNSDYVRAAEALFLRRFLIGER
jgi:dipeptidyl aminopeptidase/acylaminoacyl peptidase